MTISKYNINLNLNKNQVKDTLVYLTQNDTKTTEFIFKIYDQDDVEIDYNNISTATVVIKRLNSSATQCLCNINEDSISYIPTCQDLRHAGIILASVQLNGSGSERITTQQFSFVVVGELISGTIANNDTNIPVLQSLILETTTLCDGIQDDEELRKTAENNRTSSETAREQAETLRGQTFAQLQSDYDDLVTSLSEECLNQISFNSESVVGSSEDNIIFEVLNSYQYKIKGIKIISRGDAVGLDVAKTSVVEVTDGTIIYSTVTFDDSTAFPSKNNIYTMTIDNDTIIEDKNIHLKVTNHTDVTTPEFTIQMDYLSSKYTV